MQNKGSQWLEYFKIPRLASLWSSSTHPSGLSWKSSLYLRPVGTSHSAQGPPRAVFAQSFILFLRSRYTSWQNPLWCLNCQNTSLIPIDLTASFDSSFGNDLLFSLAVALLAFPWPCLHSLSVIVSACPWSAVVFSSSLLDLYISCSTHHPLPTTLVIVVSTTVCVCGRPEPS